MKLSEFNETIVEGYLLHDLKNMIAIRLRSGEIYGKAGYPILATIASGTELLGSIICPKLYTGNASDSRDRFNHYCTKMLSEINPGYSTYSNVYLWDLVRNGIGHLFLTRPNILVSKDNSGKHLLLENGTFYINAKQYYIDFEKSYWDYYLPFVQKHKDITDRNFNQIQKSEMEKSKKHAPELITSNQINQTGLSAVYSDELLKEQIQMSGIAATGASGSRTYNEHKLGKDKLNSKTH